MPKKQSKSSRPKTGFSALDPDDRAVLWGFAKAVAEPGNADQLRAAFLDALQLHYPDVADREQELNRLVEEVRAYYQSPEHYSLMAPSIIRLVEIGNRSHDVRKLFPRGFWPWPDTIRSLKKACPQEQ